MKSGNHIGVVEKNSTSKKQSEMINEQQQSNGKLDLLIEKQTEGNEKIDTFKETNEEKLDLILDSLESQREAIGSEIVQFNSTSISTLTIPNNAVAAHLQVKGVESKISLSTDPVTGLTGYGISTLANDLIFLESRSELEGFKIIAMNNGEEGEIFVEYFTK